MYYFFIHHAVLFFFYYTGLFLFISPSFPFLFCISFPVYIILFVCFVFLTNTHHFSLHFAILFLYFLFFHYTGSFLSISLCYFFPSSSILSLRHHFHFVIIISFTSSSSFLSLRHHHFHFVIIIFTLSSSFSLCHHLFHFVI